MFVGKFIVHGRKGIEPSLNIGLVLSVEVNLHKPLSVSLNTGPLSGDLSGVNQVLEDGILDSGQSSGTGEGSLGLLTADVGFSENSALSDKQNMTAGELLLKLPYKTSLDLVEGLKKFEWDVDNDGFTASSTVNLLSGGDVKVTEGSLELGRSHLKVEQFLGYCSLEFISLLWSFVIKARYKNM